MFGGVVLVLGTEWAGMGAMRSLWDKGLGDGNDVLVLRDKGLVFRNTCLI